MRRRDGRRRCGTHGAARPNEAWFQRVEFLRETRPATRHRMPGRPGGRAAAIFTVRNRIGYRLVAHREGPVETHHTVLQAVDLSEDGGRVVDVLKLPAIDDHRGIRTLQPTPPIPHVVADEGLWFWTGDAWTLTAWLTELPEEE